MQKTRLNKLAPLVDAKRHSHTNVRIPPAFLCEHQLSKTLEREAKHGHGEGKKEKGEARLERSTRVVVKEVVFVEKADQWVQ